MTKKETKPDCANTMFITAVIKDHLRNMIVPLSNIRIEKDIDIKVCLGLKRESIALEPCFYELISIGVTDDPYCEWSSDWGHLGTFRLALNLKEATILDSEMIEIVCKQKNYEKRMNMPDRMME